MLNNYFGSECTPIKNDSKLKFFSYKTEEILASFDIKDDYLLPIINKLYVNKAHGWDQLSIRMIYSCGDSITFLLKLIFRSMTNGDLFSYDWKKSNVVPIHKKESKNQIKIIDL